MHADTSVFLTFTESWKLKYFANKLQKVLWWLMRTSFAKNMKNSWTWVSWYNFPKHIISYKLVWIYITTNIPIKCCINPTNGTSLLSPVSECILPQFSLHVLVPLPKVKTPRPKQQPSEHLWLSWHILECNRLMRFFSCSFWDNERVRKSLDIIHSFRIFRKSLEERFPGEEYQYHIVCLFNFSFFWNKMA